ncbi:MAG TPA: metallophosphoesterase [Myxococcota bacterium]|nr:metallophosphoesterase [Myxococcota bacterium]
MDARDRPDGLTRRDLLRGGAGVLAAGALPGCRRGLDLPPGRRLVSYLAVGDIGDPHGLEGRTAAQWLVARAMAAQHRVAPVDGLLFLGDHFYPDGLANAEFEERVGDQIVAPYRDFVTLTPRGQRLYGGPAEAQPPVRILAVLGNHDFGLPESPGLQIEGIPRLVANWHMPAADTSTVDLGHGVRVALLHEPRWGKNDARALAAALVAEPADFWIVAGHYPLPEIGGEHAHRVERKLRAVYREVRRPVHLQICGHEHNLQVLRTEPPGPALIVVAGGGSNTHALSPTRAATRDFGLDSLGFARIDVVGATRAEALRVTLFAVDRLSGWRDPAGRRVACSWIDRDGRVRTETRA